MAQRQRSLTTPEKHFRQNINWPPFCCVVANDLRLHIFLPSYCNTVSACSMQSAQALILVGLFTVHHELFVQRVSI